MISDVVRAIFEQINGRQLQVMIGAKEFSQTAENELSFKIGRNCKSVNRIIITYNYGTDLYKIRFCRDSFSRKTFEFKRKIIKEVNDCFCDDLIPLIEENTGMTTVMPRVIFG